MKRFNFFFCFLILLFFTVPAMALDWQTTNQSTIAWDAYVGTGNPGDEYRYNVYIKNQGDAVGTLVSQEQVATQFTATFTTEGFYIVGVSTVRFVDLDLNGTYDPTVDVDENGDPVIMESPINWSDVNGVSTPNPFGIRYFVAPGQPAGLRPAP
ncbi:MAG: hypothetical protein ACYTBJ_00880 [Planctomycetota bacterium]|jgi:hypothetical protein